MKKKFIIDVWDFVKTEDINNKLDEVLEKDDIIPVDITYECLSITKDGTLTIEAEFTRYKE